MQPDEVIRLILEGVVAPAEVRVAGRDQLCPICSTSAWYGPRHFPGQPYSYYLCKWCGIRWSLAEGPEAATLALPVFHACPEGLLRLTWHQFEGEPYRLKTWHCDCGSDLLVIRTLRPFPRFGREPILMELPGM